MDAAVQTWQLTKRYGGRPALQDLSLALALRPVAVAAEVKAGLVAVLSVGLCFGIGRMLVRQTILGRIL